MAIRKVYMDPARCETLDCWLQLAQAAAHRAADPELVDAIGDVRDLLEAHQRAGGVMFDVPAPETVAQRVKGIARSAIAAIDAAEKLRG